MVVYLFFVFTCGWCVCWLLFLNYQKHSQQPEEGESCPANRGQLELMNAVLECDGALGLELERGPGEMEPVELVVDCEGGHLVMSGESAECIKFCRQEESQCECLECWERSVAEHQQQHAVAPGFGFGFGWPEEETGVEESFVEGEELVPVVELRENPLSQVPDLETRLLNSTASHQIRQRSRLLSEGQQERRAAIRLVSSG